MPSLIRLILVLAFSLLTVPVWGHSIWVEHDKEKQLTVRYGHVGEDSETYDTNKVKKVAAFDADGSPLAIESKAQQGVVTLHPEKPAALVAVTFDNGFWVETKDGWKNVSKRQVPEYISASHTFKHTKAYFGWNDNFAKPVGLTLEIVPLANPFELSKDQPLPVLVLYNGKPVPGVEVACGQTSHKTDDDGKAAIKLTNASLHYLEVGVTIPLENNPDTDKISHASTLTFRAAK